MFIVKDIKTANSICQFYENPDHIGWRDELLQMNLLDRVEEYIDSVRKLSLKDFIKNDRWAGITKEMDMYLPTVISDGISRNDVLRAISVSSNNPINDISICTGEISWFRGRPNEFTELTINIEPGMPTGLLYYETTVIANTVLTTCISANTFLPTHIYRQLKSCKQVIVPSQGQDYYLIKGELETL